MIVVRHEPHFAATLAFLAACTLIACQTGATPRASEERVEPVQGAAREPQAPPREERREPLPPQPPAASPREQVKVGGALLTLEGCELTVDAAGVVQKRRLPMPDGCVFAKSKPGGPAQVETTAGGSTLLVVSSKPLAGRDCDTRVRAVVVGKHGVEISSKEQEISMCGADGPFDTPMFITLAASAKRM